MNIINNIDIDLLCYHHKCIVKLSAWYASEWLINYDDMNSAIACATEILQKRVNTKLLDICFIAMECDVPIGMISLCNANIPMHPDLFPCISNLYVVSNKRNAGIAKLLLKKAISYAKLLEYNELYLYTDNPTMHIWYAKLGWEIIESFNYKHFHCVLMKHSIY